MEMIRFSLWNLWKKPKDAAFFAFAIVATAAVITIFFSIINDPNYGRALDRSENLMEIVTYEFVDDEGTVISMEVQDTNVFKAMDRGIGSGIFTVMLSLIIIAICTVVIFFSNKFFLLSKTKDIGIMMVCGNPVARVVKFFMVQNFAILFIFAPLGALLGLAFTPIINMFVYNALQLHASIYTFTPQSAMQSFITLMMVGVWLVIVDAGFVYRCSSLADLLKAEKHLQGNYSHKIFFLPYVYFLIYIIGIIVVYMFPVDQVIFLFMLYVGGFIYFGFANMFRFVIPAILGFVRRHYFSANKHRLISLGNLQYSIKGANSLAMITLLSTSILAYYLGKFYTDQGTFAVVMVAYFVCLFLINICLIYKICADAVSKLPIFLNLLRIGYLKKDVVKIIHQEVFWFYACFIILSLPQLIAIELAYLRVHLVTVSFVFQIALIFVGMIALSAIFTNIAYQKLILKHDNRRIENE